MSSYESILFLLLASACVWHCGISVALRAINNFGIYGGTPVNITEVPYMAQFLTDMKYNITAYCGACVIHEQFLLSAGHCAGVPGKIRIIVGSDKFNKGDVYEAQKVVRHPKFSYNTVDYDLSVIKLKKKLIFSDRVKPIKMADSNLFPVPGETLETMGFGLRENGVYLDNLFKVTLPYVDRELCQKELDHNMTITKRMFCAGGEKGKGSCNGDGGGPIIYKNRLLGVTSWGNTGCGLKDKPTVYSYVPSMRDFIEKIMKNGTQSSL